MNRLRLRPAAALLTALSALSACGKTDNVSPSDVVVQFYVTIEVSGIRDLPEPRALLALEPYLTDSLALALREARARRDAAPATPGRPAPLSEGNPFSGLFEGHSSYVVKGADQRGDSAFVTVAFTNTDQKPAVSWSDTLVLVNTAAATTANTTTTASAAAPAPVRWRIADLRYGGGWEFGYRGTLRQVLRSAVPGALP